MSLIGSFTSQSRGRAASTRLIEIHCGTSRDCTQRGPDTDHRKESLRLTPVQHASGVVPCVGQHEHLSCRKQQVDPEGCARVDHEQQAPCQDREHKDAGEPRRECASISARDQSRENDRDRRSQQRGSDYGERDQLPIVDRQKEPVLGRRKNGRIGRVQEEERAHDREGATLALTEVERPLNLPDVENVGGHLERHGQQDAQSLVVLDCSGRWHRLVIVRVGEHESEIGKKL